MQVTWYPDDAADEDLGVLGPMASQGTKIGEGVRFGTGRAHFVMVDLHRPDLFDALDAREVGLAYLAGILFPHLEDGQTNEIEDELRAPGSDAVLVNSVEIDPPWRGQKLGLLSTVSPNWSWAVGAASQRSTPWNQEPRVRLVGSRSTSGSAGTGVSSGSSRGANAS